LSPDRQIRPGRFVNIEAGSVEAAELAASFQVGLHNGPGLLWRTVLTAEGGNGNWHLFHADA
jgi:hypothetical protein